MITPTLIGGAITGIPVGLMGYVIGGMGNTPNIPVAVLAGSVFGTVGAIPGAIIGHGIGRSATVRNSVIICAILGAIAGKVAEDRIKQSIVKTGDQDVGSNLKYGSMIGLAAGGAVGFVGGELLSVFI